jgi:hypothetical protein
MITVARSGWNSDGLIEYLMGPGRAEEHENPRVIASWDGLDTEWQPAKTGPGEWDFELGPLCRAVGAAAVAAGLPDHDDGSTKQGYVWHLSARLAEADRVLSDDEWAQAARELVAGANVASPDDPGGPRWVAIRHADDHIHVAAVLVRQDTSRRFWPRNDRVGLRRAARDLERRWGLTETAAADGTAAKAPLRGELEKARRQGRGPARIELARAVRVAALAGDGPEEFAAALHEAGYLVELRRAPSGDVIGYKVARPGDLTAGGEAVFYSGSKLAPDLSMPRLQQRWSDGPPPAGRANSGATRRSVEQARRRVAAHRGGRGEADVAEVVAATGDLLVGMGARVPELGEAAQAFDRAGRVPRGMPVGHRAVGAGLRHAARQLVRRRRLGAGDDQVAMVALLVAVAALVHEIAGWLRERDRTHQAVAAESAASGIDRCAYVMGSAVAAAAGASVHGRRRTRVDGGPAIRQAGPVAGAEPATSGTSAQDERAVARSPAAQPVPMQPVQLALPLVMPPVGPRPPIDRAR